MQETGEALEHVAQLASSQVESFKVIVGSMQHYKEIFRHVEDAVYRSTVFWTPLGLKLGGISHGTSLLQSHLGRCFVSMPSNQPGCIVLTLKLVQR
jgi:hypothetical protein